MYRIAIVICYFGDLPWYFVYFLHSCRYNYSIDFLVFSDSCKSYDLPNNVRIIPFNIEHFRLLASSKLGFSVALNSPYKLTDYKPAYGLIFREFLTNYDFWGHGDLDVIYGNIRTFITDEILANNDVITVRHDHVAGVFTLFKNSEEMRWLFTQSRDYRTVMTSDEHFCFDETNFMYDEFREPLSIRDIPMRLESMTHLVKRKQEEGTLKVYFDFHILEGAFGSLFWERGTLRYKNRFELLLFHLIYLKRRFIPKRIPLTVPDCFRISKNRIY